MIRRLTSKDRAALQILQQSQHASLPAPWETLDDAWQNMSSEKWDSILRACEENTGQILLGAFDTDSSELIGVVGLRCEPRPTTRHKASLWGLYVAPEKRRQGIGRQLVTSLILEAQATPLLEMIRLTVATDNIPTVQLLQSQGFMIYAVEPHSRFLDGIYYDQAFLFRYILRSDEEKSS